jgi:hypothetical protein
LAIRLKDPVLKSLYFTKAEVRGERDGRVRKLADEQEERWENEEEVGADWHQEICQTIIESKDLNFSEVQTKTYFVMGQILSEKAKLESDLEVAREIRKKVCILLN